MEQVQVIKELESLKKTVEGWIKSVNRKKWRPSEKAMAIADYNLKVAALDVAIAKMQA